MAADTKRHEPSTDDRISNLPDPVHARILSFLPTKDAVATTSLSSKWKFTWKYTNTLNFYYPEHRTRLSPVEIKNRFIRFLDFVNRVLILHPLKSIRTFSINFDSEHVVYDSRVLNNLNAWLTAAVDRNVQCFELRGILDKHSTYFQDVDFGCEESVHKLISGCLSLHTLYVRRIAYDNVHTFSVKSQTLEHLTIFFCDEYQSFYEESTNGTVFKIVINAPALKYLCVDDGISSEILVDSLPLLNEAKICLDDDLIKDRFASDWNSVRSLFQPLHNVRRLTLSDYAYRVLQKSGVSAKFPKVIELNLDSLCCEWYSFWLLLEDMPFLETLALAKRLHYSCGHELNTSYTNPKEVPVCLTSRLKIVSIFELTDDNKDQFPLLGYILENARLLETMKITTSLMNTVEKLQLLKAVSNFRRLSEKCRLEFR